MRGHLDHLFYAHRLRDLVGLPLLPPYYAMRLLPYILPTIQTWKRSLLRERELDGFCFDRSLSRKARKASDDGEQKGS